MPRHQQTTSSVHTTNCKHSLVLLRMGEIIARKHVELIEIIDKSLLLHLVDVYIIILPHYMLVQFNYLVSQFIQDIRNKRRRGLSRYSLNCMPNRRIMFVSCGRCGCSARHCLPFLLTRSAVYSYLLTYVFICGLFRHSEAQSAVVVLLVTYSLEEAIISCLIS